MNHSSSNASKHPYLRPLFYSDPEHQFWQSSLYSDSYRERMQRFVAKLERSNKVHVNLIK
jgi:hypothetical protein